MVRSPEGGWQGRDEAACARSGKPGRQDYAARLQRWSKSPARRPIQNGSRSMTTTAQIRTYPVTLRK